MRHSRAQLEPIASLPSSSENSVNHPAQFMNELVNTPSAQVSASRRDTLATATRFESQLFGPAAARRLALSLSLVSGGKQVRGRSAWAARSKQHLLRLTRVTGPSSTLQAATAAAQCCLTPRSSRAPTAWHAGHQAVRVHGVRPATDLSTAWKQATRLEVAIATC